MYKRFKWKNKTWIIYRLPMMDIYLQKNQIVHFKVINIIFEAKMLVKRVYATFDTA